MRELDRRFEAAIIALLKERANGATICPSEAVRSLFPHASTAERRGHMEAVRAAARRLRQRGRIEITQRGQVVDPAAAKGPIRLRLRNWRG